MAKLDPPALLDLIVRLGLAQYLRGIEDAEIPLLLAIRDGEAAARDAGLDRLDWPAQRDWFARAWAAADGPLRRLSATLDASELFILGLAAACERRRGVALAVAALQAPVPAARPTMHLALDIVHRLGAAGAGDALALAAGPLTTSGLLTLEGADALPHRVLALRLPLWRALTGAPPAWPGCAPLAPADATAPAPIQAAAQAVAAGEAGGIVLRGPPGSGRAAAASAIAASLGLAAIEVPPPVFHDDPGFATACRFAGWLPVLRLDTPPGDEAALPAGRPAIVLAATHGAVRGDRLIEISLTPPPRSERLRLWRAALGPAADGIDAAALAAAVLYPATITAVARAARLLAADANRPAAAADLAAARLAMAPAGLRHLAHPVARHVGAAALVAGPALAADLAAVIARCRGRETVWDGLGPSLAASATRGVRILFAGESGTGKTMAAAYIATALGAPLFRCDLAAVMNKYIGESEKNLGSLLDHAEAADVVLLFDEADALFGRRTEGNETGERYANMLTNYLLTRLEAHNGIVILTANSKARIDPAFWRRLDQIVDFPMPGHEERLALWRGHLGARAPSDAVLERLASYCDLAGGGVRNAVLSAAAAAPGQGPIGLDALTPALQREYAKLRRTLPAGLVLAMRAAE
jgi:hypothetical protein